mmetsp:Transcript_13876/g.17217  ORF Transcript_13876/g.17217 Transcript_13876/m.17217 type:complete len:201 (+) Transcript_13876:161-763(+)
MDEGLSLPPSVDPTLASSSSYAHDYNVNDSRAETEAPGPDLVDFAAMKVAKDKNADQPAPFRCPACFKPLGTPQAYRYHTKNNVCLKRAERHQRKSVGEVLEEANVGADANLYDLSFRTTLSKAMAPITKPPKSSSSIYTAAAASNDSSSVTASAARYTGKPQRITMDPNVLKGYNENKRFYEIGEYYYPSPPSVRENPG